MPKPRAGEKQSAYISRCVKEVMGEGQDQKAALGQCYGMWRQHHGSTAKLFTEVIKQPAVQGVHVPRALPGISTMYDQLDDPNDRHRLEFAQEEADLTHTYPPEADIEGEDRTLARRDSDITDITGGQPPQLDEHDAEYSLRAGGALMKVVKTLPDRQIIFGWASVAKKNGDYVVDKQGDVIPVRELENAVLDYVVKRGDHAIMHDEFSGGRLVMGWLTTPEFMEPFGLVQKDDQQGFIGAWHIEDPKYWQMHKEGKFPELSIAGRSVPVEMTDDEIKTLKAQEARGTKLTRRSFRYP